MMKFNNILAQNIHKSKRVGYQIRTDPQPKHTITVYKIFTYKNGKLYAKFVNANHPFPIGVWLDAVQGYSFVADNGRKYVPTKGQGGQSIDIPDIMRQQLYKLGYINNLNVKTINCVAYRPGIHASTLPLSPQMGINAKLYPIKNYPYKNYHKEDQVFAQIELDMDINYQDQFQRTATRTKDNRINLNLSGIPKIPKGGSYAYTTNMANRGKQEDVGTWYISGGMKINRILSRQQVHQILQKNGVPKQLWVDQAKEIYKK